MDEEMMMRAALEQGMPQGAGGAPMGASPEMMPPMDGSMGGSGLVTIQVPEFALPMIAELLSSLAGGPAPAAPMM